MKFPPVISEKTSNILNKLMALIAKVDGWIVVARVPWLQLISFKNNLAKHLLNE